MEPSYLAGQNPTWTKPHSDKTPSGQGDKMDEFGLSMMNLSNVTNITDEEKWRYLRKLDDEHTLYVLAGMIYLGILSILGFFGNTLVAIVYIKNFQNSTSRIFILALAGFDLVNNLFATPGEMIQMRFSYTFESIELCKFIKVCKYFTIVGSVFTLVAISADRYRKICKPFKKQINELHAKVIVVLIAISSLVFTLPSLVVHSSVEKETDIPGIVGKECAFEDSSGGIWFTIYFVGLPIVMFITCFTVLCVLYILVGKQIFHQSNFNTRLKTKATADSVDLDAADSRLTHNDTSGSTSALNQREITPSKPRKPVGLSKNRTTLMLLSITAVFIISFVPYLIIAILKLAMKNFKQTLSMTGYQFYSIFMRSYFLNSTANPLVYSYWNKRFREGCVRLLTPWKSRKRVLKF